MTLNIDVPRPDVRHVRSGQCNGEGPTFYTCNTEAFILVPKNGIGTV